MDVAFSSDGTQIVSGSEYGSVQVWDASTGVELMKLGHKVKSVAFSSDSMWIVSGSYDHYLQVWDVSAGVELKKLKGHTGSVYSVAFQLMAQRLCQAQLTTLHGCGMCQQVRS